jgi:uncharacterized RDD family membrane protein YckC
MQCPRCGLVNLQSALRCDCGYDFQAGALAVNVSRAVGLPLATFGERFAGHLLDSVLTCGGMVLGTYIGVSLGVGSLPAVGLFLGYLLLSDGLGNGQSFGKKLVNIAVVDEKTGAPCTYGGSMVRNVLRMLGVFDWAFMFGERRQRLGDKAAGTVVVKVRT